MGRFHYSKPDGWAFIRALLSHGGSATSQQIRDATRRHYPNNMASSARRVLQDLGVPAWHDPVDCAFVGFSENDRRVYRYSFTLRVREMIRFGLLEGRPVQTVMF